MSDLISRQAVLDKFKSLCDVCGEGEKYDGVMCRCCRLDDGICIVEDMPPAEKWIPVSEALPKEKGEYLVSYHPCHWSTVSEKVVVGMDTFRGKTTWAKKKYQKVIAWMPLPEPWRGE